MKNQFILVLALVVTVSGATNAGETRTGKEVADAVCGECHLTGKMGAPKIGDRQDWLARIVREQGLANLSTNAIRGVRNMPAHGGKGDITDLEITRAITYMLNAAVGTGQEPQSPYSSPVAMSDKSIVAARCSQCHAEGKAGAPRIGHRSDWTPRMAKGIDAMVVNAIRGHNNMPARGGVIALSDAEMRSAALFMLTPQVF